MATKYVLLGATIALLAASANAATVQPSAGIYLTSIYTVSASTTNGGTCNFTQGDTYQAITYYPGPGKLGLNVRLPIDISGLNATAVSVATTKTPAAGVTSWRETATATLEPGGTPFTVKASWTATFIDANSFLANVTLTYPVSNTSKCTNVLQENFVRTGS